MRRGSAAPFALLVLSIVLGGWLGCVGFAVQVQAYETPCSSATAAPTPTAGPSPTSGPLNCATQVTDPQELGALQDTVIVVASIVIPLLAIIAFGVLRHG